MATCSFLWRHSGISILLCELRKRIQAPIRHWKTLNGVLILSLFMSISGCITTLGYYPDNLKVRQLQEKDAETLVPEYKVVKEWAYDVQDGLDSRATINHYALEYGAILGLAAAGTMAGLAIFSPNSDALKGIPIGAAFLSGTAAYYDNHYRYDLFSRASARVRALIDVSDERVTQLTKDAKDLSIKIEARCLKLEVGKVVDLVRKYITRSEPDNLAAELRAVGTDQNKIADLVKAARGDLSDLDIPRDLRDSYCQDAGLSLPAALKYPGLLATTTQTALMDLSQNQVALDMTIANGEATVSRLTKQVDGFAKAKGESGESVVKAARGKITDLDKAVQDAKTRIKPLITADTITAAGYITTLTDDKNPPTREKFIDTSLKLIGERERIKGLNQEATKAAAKISDAIQDAEAAVKAVQ